MMDKPSAAPAGDSLSVLEPVQNGGHAIMKLRYWTLSASLSLVVLALIATGATADVYRPRGGYVVVAPFASWTGFYIGGNIGGAWSDVDWSNLGLTDERFDKTVSGFIGGGQIGYNQQIGNMVLGVEATLSGADLNRDFRSIVAPTVSFNADVNTIATVTGRFGVAADQWLFYGKAGWAGAQVEFSGRNTIGPDRFSFDDWHNGWTAGVGLEYKVARNVSFGVEYSFVGLDSDTHNGLTRLAVPFTVRDRDLDIQSVTARLNFQFYRDEYRAPPPLK
jgi:outer membrane immunogenic protein